MASAAGRKPLNTSQIGKPVAFTRAASQYTSLHQQCSFLRSRLMCIHKFPDFFALTPPESSQQSIDAVTRLWDCFALGISLCYLFNLLPSPVIPIRIETDPSRFDVNNVRARKRAIALFAMQIKQVAHCEPFTVRDLWDRNITDGFVKVINAVIILINRLPGERFVSRPESPRSLVVPVEEQDMVRCNAIRELVETEREYVHDLEIMQNFSTTLSQGNTLSQDEIHLLFPGLKKLLNFQRKFLIRLESTIDAPWKGQRWGSHFIENEEEFSVYEIYCSNYTNAINLFIANEQSLMVYNDVVNVKSVLPVLLIKPIQRICLYPLLLDSVIESSSPTNYPHYDELKAGSAAAKRVAYKANEARRRAENMQIVNSLADLVENWKGYILSNFGELLLHDVFFIMQNDVERVYRVFLFEKILLCCKEVPLTPPGLKKVSKKFWKQSVRAPLSSSGGQWQPKKDTTLLLKGRIFMWNITRTESPAFIESKATSSTHKYGLWVYWRNEGYLESFVMCCWSEEQRKQWGDQMNQLTNKSISERLTEQFLPRRHREITVENQNGLYTYGSSDDQVRPNSPINYFQRTYESGPPVSNFEHDEGFEGYLVSGQSTPMGLQSIEPQSMRPESDANSAVIAQRTTRSAMLPPVPPISTMQLKVHKNLIAELQRRLLALTKQETRLLDELQTYIQQLTTLDATWSLVRSSQIRTKLMAMAMAQSCQDDPKIRKALDDDDNDVVRLLRIVITSDTDKNVVLQLKGADADCLLTLTHDILDMHHSGSVVSDQVFRQKAQRLMIRLSENSGILPRSLSTLVVKDCTAEPVAGGRFADIFHASHQGNPVAVKRVREFQGHEQNKTVRRKFLREAQLWNDLQHPNVLPFFGVDLETFYPRVCMVSPWMQQGTLPKHIQRLGGPQNVNVDKYILEVAEGLEYLHSRNIIHGDLKGTNILIDDDWHVKIADFGLANWADAASTASTSHHAGTVRWMAPELLSFDAFQRTTASDVYAFACVCLEIYTGKYPFLDILQDVAVIVIIKGGQHPQRPAAGTGKIISDDLWDLIQRCWKEKPADRPHIRNVVRILMSLRNIPL